MFARFAVLASVLAVAPALKVDPCPFGYGTNCGGGTLDSATKAQVASILEGILGKLQSHKALMQNKTALGNTTLPVVPQPRKPTSAPVKRALQSLLSELRSNDKQMAAKVAFARTLQAAIPDIGAVGCNVFRSCDQKEARPLTESEKKQIADILNGIIGNLSKHK